MKTKMLHLLRMFFIVKDRAVIGIYKELKAYSRYHV